MLLEDETDEMEMPTPCQHCGEWFDLLNGTGSKKWFPDTVICDSCGEEEALEIENDEEIQDLQNSISDAEITILHGVERLKELGIKSIAPVSDLFAGLFAELEKIINISEDRGREGCTWGDTDFDSMSVAFGFNTALRQIKESIKVVIATAN